MKVEKGKKHLRRVLLAFPAMADSEEMVGEDRTESMQRRDERAIYG